MINNCPPFRERQVFELPIEARRYNFVSVTRRSIRAESWYTEYSGPASYRAVPRRSEAKAGVRGWLEVGNKSRYTKFYCGHWRGRGISDYKAVIGLKPWLAYYPNSPCYVAFLFFIIEYGSPCVIHLCKKSPSIKNLMPILLWNVSITGPKIGPIIKEFQFLYGNVIILLEFPHFFNQKGKIIENPFVFLLSL